MIISVSRRTDIHAFYSEWFINERRKTPVFRHGDIRRVHIICVSN